jgi:hypothetical protein
MVTSTTKHLIVSQEARAQQRALGLALLVEPALFKALVFIQPFPLWEGHQSL